MEAKIIILFIFLAFFSCSKPTVEKPEVLLQEEKIIDMLVDIHLAEATFNSRRHRDSLVMKSSSADFYYSILDKHQVADSVFEQSFVFYASQPRKFEKMYRQAMNKLNEMEQEYSGRTTEPQELELQRNR
ncbi:DUF4296 domain-containing protein [Mariniphaga sp.]|uniref:DUF4296 domain-containing protein n=1 Tax=Mariniphaga sp. TaxID=1954475 RepID=UPI0035631B4A